LIAKDIGKRCVVPVSFIVLGILFLLIVFDVIVIKNLKLKLLIVVDYLLYLLGHVIGDIDFMNLSFNLFILLAIVLFCVLIKVNTRVTFLKSLLISLIVLFVLYFIYNADSSFSVLYGSWLPSCIVICSSLIYLRNFWNLIFTVCVTDFLVGALYVILELDVVSSVYFNMSYILNDVLLVCIFYAYYICVKKLINRLWGVSYVSSICMFDNFNIVANFHLSSFKFNNLCYWS
jgi:hypothetical protein